MALEIIGPQQCKSIPSLPYPDLLQLDEAAWTAGPPHQPDGGWVRSYARGLAAWWTVLEHTSRRWDDFPASCPATT